MSWLRRLQGDPEPAAAPEPAPADDDDSPEVLSALLAEQVRRLNRSSGQLPAAAVVQARRLTDTLGEVVETSTVRPLDVYAVISVRSTLTDYLPTTVERYLAVPDDLRDRPRAGGSTPTQSLLEQLTDLQGSASSVLVAAREQDADALMTQGAFLRTKFSGSDLDL